MKNLRKPGSDPPTGDQTAQTSTVSKKKHILYGPQASSGYREFRLVVKKGKLILAARQREKFKKEEKK